MAGQSLHCWPHTKMHRHCSSRQKDTGRDAEELVVLEFLSGLQLVEEAHLHQCSLLSMTCCALSTNITVHTKFILTFLILGQRGAGAHSLYQASYPSQDRVKVPYPPCTAQLT